ncbi:MAG: response regulator transcription factor [Bacteroidia bacterium]
MVHIVIYDDNSNRRDSLKILLASVESFFVSGVFPNCKNIESEMAELQPDVVLMDIQMPECDGIEGVKILNNLFPGVKVIMQTVFEDDDKIFDAIRYGASGYILKKAEPEKLIEAIKDVLSGGSPMTPSIASRVINFFRDQSDHNKNKFGLSDREKEILNELVEGKSYKMIADKLAISYHTVNSHIKKIYDKLQVHSVGEAISKAIHQKLI